MRPREVSYGLNTMKKFKIIKSNRIKKDESRREEYIDILEEYAASNLNKKEGDSHNPRYHFPMKALKPNNNKRIYSTKGKPIKFHERAWVSKFNPIDLGEISSYQKQVNFVTFMAMFDEREINSIDIEQLLGINLGKFDSLKKKLEKIAAIVNEAKGGGKEKALAVIKKKIEQNDNNIKNVNNVAGNIENIDKIIYGENETKILFQMK